MVKLIIHGCNGKMGQKVTELSLDDHEVDIIAGVDTNNVPNGRYMVFKDLYDIDNGICLGSIDKKAVVDFSGAAAVDRLLDYCLEKKLPLVLCTTGLSTAQLNRVQEASKTIPILRSANMSMGINLIKGVLMDIAPVLAQAGFDVEIVEKHHNLKKDAPSGTAVMLADAISETSGIRYEYVTNRSGKREQRDAKELGISSVRGGTIVGEHDVIFAGVDETITLSHAAYSKAVFAKGALEAAKWLAGVDRPGYYTMADVFA